MQRTLAAAVVSTFLTVCLTPAAVLAAPTPKQQNGITYVNGGVGEEEQAAMKAQRADYNPAADLRHQAERCLPLRRPARYLGCQGCESGDRGIRGRCSLPSCRRARTASAAAEGKTFQKDRQGGQRAQGDRAALGNDNPDDPGPQE